MQINTSYPCDPRNYRRGRRDTVQYIVIHYVGATGSALDNVKYYGSSNVGASAHFYVGHASEDGAVYQSVDPADCAWHCGSETGRYYSPCRNDSAIGIELCCHKNYHGEWYFDSVTVEKAAELTKNLMDQYGIDADHVLRHYDVTHKRCPAPFVNDVGAWENFKNSLKEEANMPLTVQKLSEIYVQTMATRSRWGSTFSTAKSAASACRTTLTRGFSRKTRTGARFRSATSRTAGGYFRSRRTMRTGLTWRKRS